MNDNLQLIIDIIFILAISYGLYIGASIVFAFIFSSFLNFLIAGIICIFAVGCLILSATPRF
jgi:hypothetical protein